MRPRYESETDRANERIVEDALRNLGIEAHKLPVSYRLDWLRRRTAWRAALPN